MVGRSRGVMNESRSPDPRVTRGGGRGSGEQREIKRREFDGCRRRRSRRKRRSGEEGRIEEKKRRARRRDGEGRGEKASAERRPSTGWGYVGLTESGVRATCYGAFTIVYRHRSTELPLPYTDSHILGAHQIKTGKNDRRKGRTSTRRRRRGRRRRGERRRSHGRKEKGKERRKGAKENTIDGEGTDKRNDLPTTETDRSPPSTSIPLRRFTPTITTNEQPASARSPAYSWLLLLCFYTRPTYLPSPRRG